MNDVVKRLVAYSLVVIAYLSYGSYAFAELQISLDQPPHKLKPKALQSPYKKSEFYHYSRTDTIDRIVYNPWLSLEAQQEVLQVLMPEDRTQAYFSMEYLIKPVGLRIGGAYHLSGLLNAVCFDTNERQNPCDIELVLRCYDYQGNRWGMSYELQKRLTDTDTPLRFEHVFEYSKCRRGLHFAVRSHLGTGLSKLDFHDISFSLLESEKNLNP